MESSLRNLVFKVLIVTFVLQGDVAISSDFPVFFKKFQDLQKENKKNEIAELFSFPMSIELNLVLTEYKTKQDFIDQYTSIFTESVRASIANHKYRKLKKYWVIGNGSVWFEEKQGDIKIYRIFK